LAGLVSRAATLSWGVNHANPRLVGVISDTHGLMRPPALDALAGSDLIIHAGDVGRPEVLDALRAIAPVHAVRGNVDTGSWAARLPTTELVDAGGHLIYVLHIIDELDLDPPTAGFAAVIFGHSHKPSIETRNGVLWLNPGSAGPRRFSLPVSVATITIAEDVLHPELITLAV
jgi:putative phosphoesterase